MLDSFAEVVDKIKWAFLFRQEAREANQYSKLKAGPTAQCRKPVPVEITAFCNRLHGKLTKSAFAALAATSGTGKWWYNVPAYLEAAWRWIADSKWKVAQTDKCGTFCLITRTHLEAMIASKLDPSTYRIVIPTSINPQALQKGVLQHAKSISVSLDNNSIVSFSMKWFGCRSFMKTT